MSATPGSTSPAPAPAPDGSTGGADPRPVLAGTRTTLRAERLSAQVLTTLGWKGAVPAGGAWICYPEHVSALSLGERFWFTVGTGAQGLTLEAAHAGALCIACANCQRCADPEALPDGVTMEPMSHADAERADARPPHLLFRLLVRGREIAEVSAYRWSPGGPGWGYTLFYRGMSWGSGYGSTRSRGETGIRGLLRATRSGRPRAFRQSKHPITGSEVNH